MKLNFEKDCHLITSANSEPARFVRLIMCHLQSRDAKTLSSTLVIPFIVQTKAKRFVGRTCNGSHRFRAIEGKNKGRFNTPCDHLASEMLHLAAGL